MYRIFFLLCISLAGSHPISAHADTKNYYVNAASVAPALKGKPVQLYLREVKQDNTHPEHAVLFIHGGGTPSDVSFDTPYKDYSWMGYLAQAGFAVYALDLTGYGRSTRPAEMRDPCNLPANEQQQFIPALIKKTCSKKHAGAITDIESDWADMDAAVDFIYAQPNIKSVSLIGWSQGGPRSFGFAQRHPGKINKLVMLAPAYHRDAALTRPPVAPLEQLFWVQNYQEFVTGWDKQIGCVNQVDAPIRSVIWREMLASDELGKTWGGGVRRAPEQGTTWGFNQSSAKKFSLPTLLITGEHDRQVLPQRVHELYEDLGAQHKVLLKLGCSSHRANWEKNHLLLFKASADWLKDTKVKVTNVDGETTEDISNGIISVGYSSN